MCIVDTQKTQIHLKQKDNDITDFLKLLLATCIIYLFVYLGRCVPNHTPGRKRTTWGVYSLILLCRSQGMNLDHQTRQVPLVTEPSYWPYFQLLKKGKLKTRYPQIFKSQAILLISFLNSPFSLNGNQDIKHLVRL